MSRWSRWAAVSAAALALTLSGTPALAEAAPVPEAPSKTVDGGLVQIQMMVTATVLLDLGKDATDWSGPVKEGYECVGFAVDEDTILAPTNCVNDKYDGLATKLRVAAAKKVAAEVDMPAGLTSVFETLAETADWKIAADSDRSDTPPTGVIQVRRIGDGVSAGTVTASVSATGELNQQTFGQSSLLKLHSELDGLTPLPIAAEIPETGTEVWLPTLSSYSFTTSAPSVQVEAGEIISKSPQANSTTALQFTQKLQAHALGSPLLNEDGEVVGAVANADERLSSEPVGLRAFLEAHGVEPAAAAEEESGMSMWVWLGPLLGVIGLIVIGGAVFLIVRRSKRRAPQPPFPGGPQYAPGAPGPQPSQPHQFFDGQAGQPHQQHPGFPQPPASQQFLQQQFPQPPNPQQQNPYQPNPHQQNPQYQATQFNPSPMTPPPAGPDFDETVVVQNRQQHPGAGGAPRT